ncbi:Major facilitator superfamily MFS-1 [gut metagenome]|uniref:Major facilitator superfamily MFS-1 n=1 Tax=gut metagenome TaxID=749906 RepID=J9GRG1_9ZZZZ
MLDHTINRLFLRLLTTWLVILLAGRSLRMVLIFEAVSSNVSAASVGAIITCGAVVGALIAVLAGRFYNRFGPTVLNRTAGTMLLCAAALLYGFPTTCTTRLEATIANILICMSFVLSNTAVFRATGAIFAGGSRVIAFSRLNALNSILEILAPLGVGLLFDLYFEGLSAALGLFACLALFIPRAFPSAQFYPKAQMKSFSLWSNLRRLSTSQILLGGILAGAGIHAIISTITIVIPIAAPGLTLSTRDVGYLLAAFAFAQFVACLWLSAHPEPTKLCRRLFISLIVGGIIMTMNYYAVGFYSLLVVSMIVGAALGVVHPLSMSIIFQYAEPGAVGDIVGIRLMLNNFARILAPTMMGIALDYMTGSLFLSWIGIAILVSVGVALWINKVFNKTPTGIH